MTSLNHCIGLIVVAPAVLILGCNQDKWDPPVPTGGDNKVAAPQIAVSATQVSNDERPGRQGNTGDDTDTDTSKTVAAATPPAPADESPTGASTDDDTVSPAPFKRTPSKRVPLPKQSEPPPQAITGVGENGRSQLKVPPRPSSSPLTGPQQERLRELRAKRSLAEKVAVSKERRMVGDFD